MKHKMVEAKWEQLHGIAEHLKDDFLKVVGILESNLARHLREMHRRGFMTDPKMTAELIKLCNYIYKTMRSFCDIPSKWSWFSNEKEFTGSALPMPCDEKCIMPHMDELLKELRRDRACGLCMAAETTADRLKTLGNGCAAHPRCLKECWERDAMDVESLFCMPSFGRKSRKRLDGKAPEASQVIRLSLSDLEDFVGPTDFASRVCMISAGSSKDLAPASAAVFHCGVCLADCDMSSAITLPCEHRFCLSCLQGTFENGMQSRHLAGLTCPQPGCGFNLTSSTENIEILKTCLTEKVFDRVMDGLAMSHPSVYECRHAGCEEKVFREAEDDVHDLKCRQGHRFCGKCMLGPHLGYSCEDQERRRGTQELIQENREHMKMHMEQGWRPCPLRCQNAGGYKMEDAHCNHVHCRCGLEFCFVCGADRTLVIHHDNRWHKPSCIYYPKDPQTEPPKRNPRCPECQKLPEGVCCDPPRDDGYPDSLLPTSQLETAPVRPSTRRACAFEEINACGPHNAEDIYVIGGGAVTGGASGPECANPNHAYCLPCLFNNMRAQVAAGLVPACPGSNYPSIHKHVGGCGGCAHHLTDEGQCSISDCQLCSRTVLTQTQVEQILNLYFQAHGEPSAETIRDLGLERGMLSYGDGKQLAEGWKSRRVDAAFLRHAKMQNGRIVSCPCGHDVGELNENDKGRTCFICPDEQCEWHHKHFCSDCNQVFHYRSTCQEVLAIAEEWNRWDAGGRQAYLNEVVETRQQLEDFENRKAQHEEDLRVRKQAVEDMKKDEAWKAQRCRCCPSCGAVTQKISGCDSMVCGADYHGGNTQKGCGHRFSHSQAEAYTPAEHKLPEMAKFDSQPPKQIQELHHMICEGVPRTCDLCREPIHGPRIQCMNCPDFNVCVSCDAKQDIMAATEQHAAGHVFRVITAITA